MSFTDCIKKQIAGAGKKGILTEAQAKRITEQYEQLFEKYKKTMGDEAAAHQAAYDFTKKQSDIIAQRNENDIIAALYQKRIKDRLDTDTSVYEKYYNSLSKAQKIFLPDPKKFYRERIHRELESVYTRHKSIRNSYYKSIESFLKENQDRFGGFVTKSQNMPEIFKALGGGATNSKKAKEFAASVRPVLDLALRNYKAAGGIIGRVENYLPQNIHNKSLIRNVSKEAWKQNIAPLLDLDNMIDFETGFPMGEKKLDLILDQIYEDITSGQLSTISKYAQEGKQRTPYGSEISRRREQSRVLQFRSVDDYLEYNRKFGYGDEGLMGILTTYLDNMARDTAVLQKLGPKPKAFMNNISLEIKSRGLSDIFTKNMFDILTGAGFENQVGENVYLALEGFKNLQRAAFLGAAPVAALGDTFYIGLTARLKGLPVVDTVSRYLKSLNPKDSADLQTMRNVSFMAQSSMGNLTSAARFTGEFDALQEAADTSRGAIGKFAAFAQKTAGAVNELSGLAAMTDRGRASVQFGFMDMFTRSKLNKTSWENLDDVFKDSLESSGITKSDYDAIISSNLWTVEETGAAFVTPEMVALSGNAEAAIKYQDFLTEVGDLAINDPNLRSRTVVAGGATGSVKAGSFNRTIMSSVGMFKSFVVTNMLNFLIPAIRRSAEKGSIYPIAGIAAGTAITGFITLQISEILKGRDLLDVTDWRTWKAALLKGGGLGLFGDFMFGDESRYGHSFWEDLLGPVYGSLVDATDVIKGNFDKALDEGQESNFYSDAWRFIEKHTPGRSLWYARLPVERLFFETVEEWIDPEFQKKSLARAKRLEKRTGQKQWWKEGEKTPERSPDLTSIVGYE